MDTNTPRYSYLQFAVLIAASVGIGGGIATAGLNMAALTDGNTQRPQRMRFEEREAAKEEHRAAEDLGREIERKMEMNEDITFDEAKEQAVNVLQQAVQEDNDDWDNNDEWNDDDKWDDGNWDDKGDWDREPLDHARGYGPPAHAMGERVCFREDGSVTDVREECAMDQGQFFGATHENRQEHSDERMSQHFDGEFRRGPPHGGPDLLQVISRALQHMSGMEQELRERDPSAADAVGDTVRWLGTMLSQYDTNAPMEERMRLAEEVRSKIESVMPMMRGGRGYEGDHGYEGDRGYDGGGHMGDFGKPDFARILEEMAQMMPKIPQVIALFEKHNIPISDDARQAANDAIALFEEIRQTCPADPSSCERLPQIFDLLENRMRMGMEPAMMQSGNEEAMREIMELMDEGEDHGAPPNGDYGSPPGFEDGEYRGFGPQDGQYRDFGPPEGFDRGIPGEYGPPPGYYQDRPHESGPPPGYDRGAYQNFGPPNGEYRDYGPRDGFRQYDGEHRAPYEMTPEMKREMMERMMREGGEFPDGMSPEEMKRMMMERMEGGHDEGMPYGDPYWRPDGQEPYDGDHSAPYEMMPEMEREMMERMMQEGGEFPDEFSPDQHEMYPEEMERMMHEE